MTYHESKIVSDKYRLHAQKLQNRQAYTSISHTKNV